MNTKNQNLPERVVQRMAVMHEHAAPRMAVVNERMAARFHEWGARLNAIPKSRAKPHEKYGALYQIVDEVMACTEGQVACKRGCAHCCHIAVGMMSPEAQALGRAIGVKPAKTKARRNFEGFDFGYHNPCPFLKGNECSIYEHRPLACRGAVNLDVDALLCELIPPASPKVPYMDTKVFELIGLQIAVAAGSVHMAELRDFFPRGKA